MSKDENNKYDLEERTAVFGENVIAFVRGIKLHEVNKPLIRQIVRSSTSIGANDMEADGGSIKEGFQK